MFKNVKFYKKFILKIAKYPIIIYFTGKCLPEALKDEKIVTGAADKDSGYRTAFIQGNRMYEILKGNLCQ